MSRSVQRCEKCFLLHDHCICTQLHQVQTQTEFVVLRHWKERHKSSNSARIADLSMLNLRIIEFPLEQLFSSSPTQDWLLYAPTEEAPSVELSQPPKRVIVLDGSWRHARRMYRRISGLQQLPCWHLSPFLVPPPRIRKPPFVGGMSTFEAIARAVAELEGNDKASLLLANLRLWVNQVCRITGLRGTPAPGQSIADLRIQTRSTDG